MDSPDGTDIDEVMFFICEIRVIRGHDISGLVFRKGRADSPLPAEYFFCPRITRIDTNIGRGFVLPKLREVAHRILCFLFAFIRVFRGHYPYEPSALSV